MTTETEVLAAQSLSLFRGKVLRSSFFKNQASGDGGNRRTAQLSELVEAANLELVEIHNTPIKDRIGNLLAGANFFVKGRLPKQALMKLPGCGWSYRLNQRAMKQHPDARLLLWEATRGYSLTTAYAAKVNNLKVIAAPHNLESLVPKHVDPFVSKGAKGGLETEIRFLSKADAIFCISREEQWLLRVNGIDADLLPYYPPKAIAHQLLTFREQRSQIIPDRFLILGTAHNQPTFEGMVEQLAWLQQVQESLPFPVHIAGYGTERLAPYCTHSNFVLHGSVSNEALEELMIHTSVMLVHQQASSGSLTRIPEMLMAGIPIICNVNASRSNFHLEGVYQYSTPSELANLLIQPLAVPPIPDRPRNAEKRFIDCLQEFAL